MADPWTTISQCTEEVGRKTALLLVAWGFTPGWNGSLAFRGAPLQERYPDIAVRTKRINWSGTPVDIIIGLRVGAAFTMDSGVWPAQDIGKRNKLPTATYSNKAGTLFTLHGDDGAEQARAYTFTPTKACELISQFGRAVFIRESDGTCDNWLPEEPAAPAPKPATEPRDPRWHFLDEC